MGAGISDEDLAALHSRGQEQNAPRGQVLVREGASGGSLFVILSGSVAVSRGGRRIAELAAGDVLGEVAMLEGTARSASAVVETEARLLVVPASAVHALVDERPTLREALERSAAAHGPRDPGSDSII